MIKNLWRNNHPKVCSTLSEGFGRNARGPYNVEDNYIEIRKKRWETFDMLYNKKYPRNV